MLCHGVVDCMFLSDGFFPAALIGPDVGILAAPDSGVRSLHRCLDSVTDEKEWQRLWSVIKLNKARGTPEDMEVEDAPAGEGVQGDDCSQRENPQREEAMELEQPEDRQTPALWAKDKEARKRGIGSVDGVDKTQSRVKRARGCVSALIM